MSKVLKSTFFSLVHLFPLKNRMKGVSHIFPISWNEKSRSTLNILSILPVKNPLIWISKFDSKRERNFLSNVKTALNIYVDISVRLKKDPMIGIRATNTFSHQFIKFCFILQATSPFHIKFRFPNGTFFFYIFMTYFLQRKIKFTITRYIKNIYTWEKNKNKKKH